MARNSESKEREPLFCYLCAALGNPREAALRAGYPAPKADFIVAQLLERQDIRDKIKQFSAHAESELSGLALRGLTRLAFGSCNDAVRLALIDAQSGGDPLEGMDLFQVAEIKCPKGGGCEVKLQDRVAALELLLQHAQARENPAGPGSFYAALRESVAPVAEADKPDGV